MGEMLKSYIKQVWYGEQEYIFISSNNQCKKCNAVNGCVVKESYFNDAAKMESLGFQKFDGQHYCPHPHCKCQWYNIKSKETERLAEVEKNALLSVAKKELVRQNDIKYPVEEACGTQSEEMASAIVETVNPACWNVKVIKGSPLIPPVRSIANLCRLQSQHHVVVVISKTDPEKSFILDPYYGNISGNDSFGSWLQKYGIDPSFIEISEANAEIIRKLNQK